MATEQQVRNFLMAHSWILQFRREIEGDETSPFHVWAQKVGNPGARVYICSLADLGRETQTSLIEKISALQS